MYRGGIILFYILQKQSGSFGNFTAFRAKKLRQFPGGGHQPVKAQVRANALQGMGGPKRFLPLPILQCLAQLGKAAVL